MISGLERILSAWAEAARGGGLLLVILILAGAGLAGVYAATNLKVNTDTSSMLDPSLPFQQRSVELRNAFPQIREDVIVIATGESPDDVAAFVRELGAVLAKNETDIENIYGPGFDPFFQQNGLLYLETADLRSRLTQLSNASGLIETLIKSPQTGTLFETLAENDRLAAQSDLGGESLEKLYAELGDVVEASLEAPDTSLFLARRP